MADRSTKARLIAKVGLYALLATPLLASSSFLFPQLTAKVLAFQIGVEVTAAAAAAAWLLGPGGASFRPVWRISIAGALGLFLAGSLAASLAGVDPARSLWGFIDRQDGLVLWAHFFAWFLAARWFFAASPAGAGPYLRASFWWSAAVAATAVFEWAVLAAGGEPPYVLRSIVAGRPAGVFGNPVALGPYLLCHFFYGLHYASTLRREPGRRAELGAVAAVELLLAAGILLGRTRGVLLGLAAGSALFGLALFLSPAVGAARRRCAGVLAGLVLVAGVAAWLVPGLPGGGLFGRLLRLDQSESAAMRLLTWRSALRSIPDHPLLGWGHDAVYYALNRYYDPAHVQFVPDFKENRATWYDKAHNAYLDLAVEKGIAGVLLAGLVVFAVVRRLRGLADRRLALCLAAALTAHAVANLVAFDTFGSLFGLALLLVALEAPPAIAAPPASTRRPARGRASPVPVPPLTAARGAALAGVAAACALAVLGNVWIGRANAAVLEAQRQFPVDPGLGLTLYGEAFAIWSPYHAREKLDCAFRTISAVVANKPVPHRSAAIARAVELAREAAGAHPRDVAFQMILNDVYNALAAFHLWDGPAAALAEAAGRRALELSPGRQEAMIYLGRTYIIQKRPEQAVALNREMLATSPAFPLAHWLLGLSLVEARQLEEAKREIRTALALGYRFQTEKEPEVLRGIFGERGFNELVRPR